MEKMNGIPSLEEVNENSPEFKELIGKVEELKEMRKENVRNEKITQLSKYAEMAGLM